MDIHSALAREIARQPPLPEVPARMRAALNGIRAMVGYWDSGLPNRLANDAYREWFGVTPEELHGIHIRDLLDGALANELGPRYRAALSGQEVSGSRRIGARTYRLKAGPVYSDDDATAGMVVAVDVTDRFRQEQTWAALHEIATAVARNATASAISEQVAFIVRDLFQVESAAVVRFTGALSAEIVAMAPPLPPTLSRTHAFFADRHLGHRPRRRHRQACPGGLRPGRRPRRRTDAGRRLPVRGGRADQGPRQPVGRRHPDLEVQHRRHRGDAGTVGPVRRTGGDCHRQHRDPVQPGASGHHRPAQRTAQPSRPRAAPLARDRTGGHTRGTSLSAVVLDIDHFKKVNDTFGHLMGDVVLADVAARLRGVARQDEIVARFGGEEFVWLLPGTDGAEALLAAERARVAIESEPFGEVGSITVSAGVCDLGDAGSHSLLACADRALYAAKHAGRNHSERYGASH